MLYSMTSPYNLERSLLWCLICSFCFVSHLCTELVSPSLQPQILFTHSGVFHLSKMLPTLKLILLPTVAAIILLAMTAPITVSSDNGGNPSGSSVNIINALNDSCVLHCSSKDNDFGQVAVFSRSNYYWKFDPNIFGRTVYNCEFLWGNKRQEFPVWQGSYYDERPNCCARGPCSYRISSDGIYNALTIDTEDNGLAESWEFYRAWLPNPVPQIVN